MTELRKLKDIGFSGTQEGMTPEQKVTLKKYMAHFRKETYFHCGGCVGADEQAAIMAVVYGLRVVIHPANDVAPHKKSIKCLDIAHKITRAKPALVRNKDIVMTSEYMLFTPLQDFMILRSGTWSTYRYADSILHKSNLKVITPNGKLLKL